MKGFGQFGVHVHGLDQFLRPVQHAVIARGAAASLCVIHRLRQKRATGVQLDSGGLPEELLRRQNLEAKTTADIKK